LVHFGCPNKNNMSWPLQGEGEIVSRTPVYYVTLWLLSLLICVRLCLLSLLALYCLCYRYCDLLLSQDPSLTPLSTSVSSVGPHLGPSQTPFGPESDLIWAPFRPHLDLSQTPLVPALHACTRLPLLRLPCLDLDANVFLIYHSVPFGVCIVTMCLFS
jgi:hypothetical protein